MKRLSLYPILSLLITGLSACHTSIDATLFNNTGQGVSIDYPADTIAPARFAHFIYPNESRVLRLGVGGCVYLYEVPETLKDYHQPDFKFRAGRGVQVQVEKDFSIDLLPASYVGEMPVSPEVVLHQDGFPLRPIAKKCG